MDCDEFSDPLEDHGEVPSGLLCSEASSLSDKVVNLLGDALEEHRAAVTHKLGLSSVSHIIVLFVCFRFVYFVMSSVFFFLFLFFVNSFIYFVVLSFSTEIHF